MRKRLHAIFAALMLFASVAVNGQTLSSLPTVNINDEEYYYYEVKPKETLFGLSQRFGISRDEIVQYNPSASDGLKAYERLYFPKSAFADVPEQPADVVHKVEPGETLYGIARSYGLTVDDLIAINPSAADGIKAGETIVIFKNTPDAPAELIAPVTVTKPVEQPVVTPAVAVEEEEITGLITHPDYADNIPGAEPVAQPAVETVTTPTAVSRKHADKFTIAVMLPLQLDSVKPSRQAQMFTDFYRGFLLGAKQLRSQAGAQINIVAYDTSGSLDDFKSLAAKPEIAKVDMFIGPVADDQLNWLTSVVNPDNAYIFNCFVNKSEAYRTNRNIMQANMPQRNMNVRAIDRFMEEYDGFTPVFLARVNGAGEQSEFVDMLKQRLAENGKQFKEIVFRNVLKEEDLADLPTSGSYVFIPASGAKEEFIKFTGELRNFKTRLDEGNKVALFGYPMWLVLRGDHLEALKDLNATIYSRFFEDTSDLDTQIVVKDFTTAYGRQMLDGVPSQALMGYDVAQYVIRALRANDGDFHANPYQFDGINQDFYFTDGDCDGLVNDALLLIRYEDDGSISVFNI